MLRFDFPMEQITFVLNSSLVFLVLSEEAHFSYFKINKARYVGDLILK